MLTYHSIFLAKHTEVSSEVTDLVQTDGHGGLEHVPLMMTSL